MTDTPLPSGRSKYDRALEAFDDERSKHNHSAVTLIGAVAAATTTDLSLVLTSELVDRIDFLLRTGSNKGVLVYIIVKELEYLQR